MEGQVCITNSPADSLKGFKTQPTKKPRGHKAQGSKGVEITTVCSIVSADLEFQESPLSNKVGHIRLHCLSKSAEAGSVSEKYKM
jgi:hypothetical protein